MPMRFAIDARQRLQEVRAGHHVLIFGGARVARVLGMMECAAVADAEPVVHRQHDETVRRQILVHRVGVAVVVHVVPAEQHLPRRPAVHEDHRGLSRRRLRAPLSNSWPWTIVPSAALKVTGLGVMSCASGNSAAVAAGQRRRDAIRRSRTIADRSAAAAAPAATNAMRSPPRRPASIPASRPKSAPPSRARSTGTRKRWRRSSSPASLPVLAS